MKPLVPAARNPPVEDIAVPGPQKFNTFNTFNTFTIFPLLCVPAVRRGVAPAVCAPASALALPVFTASLNMQCVSQISVPAICGRRDVQVLADDAKVKDERY